MQNKEIFKTNNFIVELKQTESEYLFYIKYSNGETIKLDQTDFLNFIKGFINQNFKILNKELPFKKAKLLLDTTNSNIVLIFFNKWNLPIKIIYLNDLNCIKEFKNLKNIKFNDIKKAFSFQILNIIDKYSASYTDSIFIDLGNIT